MKAPPRYSAIPGRSLVAMCAGLVLAALPITDRVVPFAIVFFLIALAARLLVQRWRLRLPAWPLKILFLGAGIAGGILSTGTLLGIEAALSSLLILISLKLFESNSVRDFQVLALLAWFLGLCGLFFAQDLTRWLYVGAVCTFVGISLVRFHRGPGARSLWRSVRLTGAMALQALPIVALLFVFFPRSYGGFRFTFGPALQAGSGMSDRLEPGSVASLVINQAVAFRVDFPDGTVPEQSQMYWRGGVLWGGDGFNWSRIPGMISERKRTTLEGPAIRQRFMLEPHGMRWLFALDRPATLPRKDTIYEAGGALRSAQPIRATLRYEVTSRPVTREPDLLGQHRAEALRPPSRVSPRLRALVNSWRIAAINDRDLVQTALEWFRRERFVYTLSPGIYDGADALDDFLFSRRAGFCEHYAGAFASLMRIAGIPSRVVVGYHGGEFNRLGQYVIVRQSEAHAWSEVWIAGDGWMRVDPTSVIAPERLTLGLGSFLENAGAGAGGVGGLSADARGLRGVLRDLRLAWDNINYQWDLRILGFDEENQREFFADLGLPYGRWISYAAWGLVCLAAPFGALGLWLRRPARPRSDPVVAAWAVFCRKLTASGVARTPNEGPRAFTERAAGALPGRAGEIRRLGALYIHARYARSTAPPGEFVRAARAFARHQTLWAIKLPPPG